MDKIMAKFTKYDQQYFLKELREIAGKIGILETRLKNLVGKTVKFKESLLNVKHVRVNLDSGNSNAILTFENSDLQASLYDVEIIETKYVDAYSLRCSTCGSRMRILLKSKSKSDDDFVFCPNCKKSNEDTAPINVIIHCPMCRYMHIDKADPNTCKNCGKKRIEHEPYLIANCNNEEATSFEEWTNPPHKTHRCLNCNHLFKVANVPTNGVSGL